MKCLQITGPEKFELITVDKPEPAEGRCLIEVLGNTICNQHDASVFGGGHGADYPLENGFPGHEGVGRIADFGPGVKGFEEGDLVVMTGYGGQPLYAQYVNREAGTFFKVEPPEGYDINALACLELFACVEHGLKKIQDYADASVAVAGLGAAGLAALQLLKSRGLENLTGIDIDAGRFERARACGAAEVLNANEFADFVGMMKQGASAYFGGTRIPAPDYSVIPQKRFDIIVECSGNAWSTATSFALARDEVVMFGFCREIIPVVQSFWFASELTIKNAKMLDNEDLHTVAELTSAGCIDPAALITHRFTFNQYAQAIEKVRAGEVIKAVLTWGEDS